MLQLRDTTAASERLALPHAQSKGGTVKPEEPSGFHSQSNAQALAPHRAPLQSPVLQDQGNQLPAAPTSMPHDAQPHAAASAAEHTQAINQQDAQNGNAAAGAERQQGTMQALQMLFPQELQRTPAAPKDKPITADSVRPQAPVVDPATVLHCPYASQALLWSLVVCAGN